MKQACTFSLMVCFFAFIACQDETRQTGIASSVKAKANIKGDETKSPNRPAQQNSSKIIHVLVALCDNEYQSIVPVPAKIGNGDDPAHNLYWGAAYGVKNFFKKAREWKLVSEIQNPQSAILERVIFKHQGKDVFMIADAYRGREIKQCTIDFLKFAAGQNVEAIEVNTASKQVALYAGGAANLIVYVGHNGLMDFALNEYPQKSDDRQRDAIILACASKSYFEKPLYSTGANPLLWTTGLMAPEAYVLKDAIEGWMLNENGEKVRRRAAVAYNAYQRCGMNGALRLFSSGW